MRILGIDPAWTSKNPSGIVLIEKDLSNLWRCIRLAPSFQLFLNDKKEEDMFSGKITGSVFDLRRILQKVGKVDCIVVDMPLSNKPFSGRRIADNIVSQKYGAFLCATHTPTEEVINMGQRILEQAKEFGYCFNETIIETYPHPAIIALFDNLTQRLAYKVGKRNSYWKNLSSAQRKERLISNMMLLREKLAEHIDIPHYFFNKKDTDTMPYTMLKSYEDTLDALVCAWVGTIFLENRCVAYGDTDSKIWIPFKE